MNSECRCWNYSLDPAVAKISALLTKNKQIAAKSRQSVALSKATGYILPVTHYDNY